MDLFHCVVNSFWENIYRTGEILKSEAERNTNCHQHQKQNNIAKASESPGRGFTNAVQRCKLSPSDTVQNISLSLRALIIALVF